MIQRYRDMKTTINKTITVLEKLTPKYTNLSTKLNEVILSQEENSTLNIKLDQILALVNGNSSGGSGTDTISDLVSLGILPKQISEFTNDDIGTIISIPYTDESGKISLNNGCIEFEVVGVNHHKDINDESKPTITLMTKAVIKYAAFDAKEPDNPDYHSLYDMYMRAYGGNNRWGVSNIRQWLNSEGAANEWYTPQHEYDAEPNGSNIVNNSRGGYSNDAGFLTGFSLDIKQHIATIKNKTFLCDTDKNLLSKDFQETEDKIFLPSCTEAGTSCRFTEGTRLEKFVSPYQLIKQGVNYWLRSYYQFEEASCSVSIINESGDLTCIDAYDGSIGVAPLIVLY